MVKIRLTWKLEALTIITSSVRPLLTFSISPAIPITLPHAHTHFLRYALNSIRVTHTWKNCPNEKRKCIYVRTYAHKLARRTRGEVDDPGFLRVNAAAPYTATSEHWPLMTFFFDTKRSFTLWYSIRGYFCAVGIGMWSPFFLFYSVVGVDIPFVLIVNNCYSLLTLLSIDMLINY